MAMRRKNRVNLQGHHTKKSAARAYSGADQPKNDLRVGIPEGKGRVE
jgi:hypothetical protein